MPINIGELIKDEYKRQGLNQKEFGVLIHRHEKTIANIILRKTIDTNLLLEISKALKHDFFKYFYEEEPLKELREKERIAVTIEIENLKREVAQKEEMLLTNNRYIQSQEDVIRLLKEKERFLTK
jgi:plasmid maintenance system antidote protein VapI